MNKKDKILKDFSEKRGLYSDFLVSLKTLFENLLKKHKITPITIQCRVKDVDSLEKNFKGGKYKTKEINDYTDIIDLAAIRVVFYLESDLEKFSNVLIEEFKNQEPKNKWSKNSYNAVHFIGELNEQRLVLSEYENFSGLIFEAQLATGLYHVWNELEHDPFYKDVDDLKSVFPTKFEQLKVFSERIMEKHLKPAQTQWEIIQRDYKLAVEGKELANPQRIEDLSKSEDNNFIYKELESLLELTNEVLDIPDKRTLSAFFPALIKVFEKSQSNKTKKEKSIFGTYKGKTPDDVGKIIVRIFGRLFPRKPEEIFGLLLNLYKQSSKNIRSEVVSVIKNISKYNLDILNSQGYVIQLFLLERFKRFTIKETISYLPIICETAEEIFTPDVSGFSTGFNEGADGGETFTVTPGSLQKDDSNERLRKEFIDLLKVCFKNLKNVAQKNQIISALEMAMRFPMYGGNLKDLVVRDFIEILKFYTERIDEEPLEVVFNMHHQINLLSRQFEKEKIDELNDFQDKVSRNHEYQIYRTLIGDDVRFDFNLDYKQANEIRKNNLYEFISDIETGNQEVWKKRILDFSYKSKNNHDFDKYYYFNNFLKIVGENVPKFGIELLSHHKKLKWHLAFLLAGLRNSALKKDVEKISDNWINKSLHIWEIIRSYGSGKLPNNAARKILNKVKTIKTKNKRAELLYRLLEGLGCKKTTNNALFFEIIEELTRLKNLNWVSIISLSIGSGNSILDSFGPRNWDRFLKSLSQINNVTFDTESILKSLLNKDPKKLVAFFEMRVVHEKKVKDRLSYNAIPFDLRKLEEELQKNEEVIVNEIFDWFSRKNSDWHFQAGILLSRLFPSFSKTLHDKITKIIQSGNQKEIQKIVIRIIRWYESYQIDELALKIISKVEEDSDIWKTLLGLLHNTGGVSGPANEPILANAYRAKIERAKQWKTPHENQKKFQKEFINAMDEMIKISEKEHLGRMERLRMKYDKINEEDSDTEESEAND